MFEEEEDASGLSAVTPTASTTDEWYKSVVQRVKDNPTHEPTFKLVGGELYKYRPSKIIDQNPR